MTNDFGDFEAACVAAQEERTENYRTVAQLCWIAVENRAARVAADLFGQSEDWVQRLARIWVRWGFEEIRPEAPLHLYEVADRLPEPHEALALALKHRWSARKLQDHYDANAGAKISRVTWLKDEANLTVLPDGILVSPINRVPSGDAPARAEVTIKEVIG